MKRYWQFAIVATLCLLAALVWAQRPAATAGASQLVGVAVDSHASPVLVAGLDSGEHTLAPKNGGPGRPASQEDGGSLPDSGTALPLLAVIGFGVLAGGIISAMRTR
jgi:hypothetical protein